MAAALGEQSPSVTFPLVNRDGVQSIKKVMATGDFVGTSLKVLIRRIESLDAALGICKAHSKVLGKWKQAVAPDLNYHVINYVEAKAVAMISKALGSIPRLIVDINANPGNLVVYRRLANLAHKVLKAVRTLPEPTRLRVRRVANRLLRFADRGEQVGDRKPWRIRNCAAVLQAKITRLQASEVVMA